MKKLFVISFVFLYVVVLISGDCSMLTNCNGHGTCVNTTSTCVCYDGWGSKNDVTFIELLIAH